MKSVLDDLESRELVFLGENLRQRSESPRPGFPRQSPYDVDYMRKLKEALTVRTHEEFPETYPFSRQDKAVLRALRELGIGILWEKYVESSFRRRATAEGRQLFLAVTALIRSHVARWYRFARIQPNRRERQRAKGLLKGLGIALGSGERAPRNPTDSYSVAHGYYRFLFRIREARRLLRKLEGKSQFEKVQEVCRQLDLPHKWFLRDLGLDDQGTVEHRPLKPEQIARIWTAEMHNITEQTVSNHLSRIRRRNSHAN
jgi:hypothetical protein